MVPEGWSETKLGLLAEVVTSGSRNWAKYYSQTGSKFIRMTNLSRYGIEIIRDSMKYVDVKGDSADGKRTSLQFGDILISITAELGKIGWIPEGFGDAYINQHTALVRLDIDKTDSKFIAYLLSSSQMNNLINRFKDSGAKAGLNLQSIRNIPVMIPPLALQRQICLILTTWDQAIETTEKLIENSKAQKKALMQQLLMGKKRLSVNDNKFDRYHFSNIFKIDQNNLSQKTSGDYKFHYISLSDVKNGRISIKLETHLFKYSPSRARRIVKQGDILFANVRPNLQGFAKVGQEFDGCIASTGFSVLTPKKSFCGDYVYHYLFSAHITGQINALVVGSNYPAVNSSDVAGLAIYCPEFKEQKKISEILNICDETSVCLHSKLNYLRQEKKALMQQLLTGNRRVKIDSAESTPA